MLKTSLNIKIEQKLGEKSKTNKQTNKNKKQKTTSSVKDVFSYEVILTTGFPHTQSVKNPPAMQETPVRVLGGKDPLEKG